jgi:hypothetical protein
MVPPPVVMRRTGSIHHNHADFAFSKNINLLFNLDKVNATTRLPAFGNMESRNASDSNICESTVITPSDQQPPSFEKVASKDTSDLDASESNVTAKTTASLTIENMESKGASGPVASESNVLYSTVTDPSA